MTASASATRKRTGTSPCGCRSPSMFCVWRVTLWPAVTPVSCAVMLFPLKVMAPTVPVPSITETSPDVTGASKVRRRCRSWRYEFYPGDAGQRHIHIECSCWAMSQARRRGNQVDSMRRGLTEIIDAFLVLVSAWVEIEGSRICHIASGVVRNDGDVIAYLALVRIAFERIKRIAHRDVRRPGYARVGAPGIEQLRIGVIRSIPRVIQTASSRPFGATEMSQPVPLVGIEQVVIDLLRCANVRPPSVLRTNITSVGATPGGTTWPACKCCYSSLRRIDRSPGIPFQLIPSGLIPPKPKEPPMLTEALWSNLGVLVADLRIARADAPNWSLNLRRR